MTSNYNYIYIGKCVSKMQPCARRPCKWHSITVIMAKVICFSLLAACFTSIQSFAAQSSDSSHTLLSAQKERTVPSGNKETPVVALHPKRADFKKEVASHEARQVADWVVDSGNNRRMPFVIVDKKEAKVFVFHANGQLRGAAPALLGLAKGDDAVPGIGNRKLSSIRPEERTTPAGRFVASLGRNNNGVEILWVDYDGAVSMHRVITSSIKERRLQRLASPTPLDNRISYGCINVPVKFYNKVVHHAFTRTNGIVYILPEIKTARALFGSYDVEELVQLRAKELIATAPPSSGAGRQGK